MVIEENKLKRKKGIITQNKILSKSAYLFARYGFDNISIREIAKEADIKESSIYNHFKSKQDILVKLLKEFEVRAPDSRPTYKQLETMAAIMSFREILKNIMFSVGRNIDELLANVAIIIECERFRSIQAADAYYHYLVNEPIAYYQSLIKMMMKENKIKNNNALNIIKNYCYISLSLSQEYFMAKNGFGSEEEVVKRMLEAIDFFGDLIENK